jgi:hypothetical protein
MHYFYEQPLICLLRARRTSLVALASHALIRYVVVQMAGVAMNLSTVAKAVNLTAMLKLSVANMPKSLAKNAL